MHFDRTNTTYVKYTAPLKGVCKFYLKFPCSEIENFFMIAWVKLRLVIWAILLAASGMLLLFHPAVAPGAVLVVLCGAILPWLKAWKAAVGTACGGLWRGRG